MVLAGGQRFGVDQVAYVDFGGNPDSVRVEGSQEAVVLRDGSVLKGQLIELNHGDSRDESTPYLIIFKTDGGDEKRLPPSQVARVYFTGGASSVGTSGNANLTPGTGDGVVVSAQQKWTGSGLAVRKGDRLTFTATGEIQLSGDANDVAGGAGARSGRTAPGAPLPSARAGALIGKVGTSGPVFAIGDQSTLTVQENGQLFLGINDDETSDNRGEFRVKIVRAGRAR